MKLLHDSRAGALTEEIYKVLERTTTKIDFRFIGIQDQFLKSSM